MSEELVPDELPIDTAIAPGAHPWSKRIAVVEKFLLIGNLRAVSETENIKYNTLIDWKKQEWWGQLVEEIRASRRNVKSNKLSDLVDKSLEVIADRLERGDWVLNARTGKLIRKPVALRDVQAMTNNLLARQMQLEELTDKMENKGNNVQDTLTLLAKEFSKWAAKNGSKASLPDVEIIPTEVDTNATN